MLLVTDFTAGRITVLTRDGELVEHLCASDRSPEEDGWTSTRDGEGARYRASSWISA